MKNNNSYPKVPIKLVFEILLGLCIGILPWNLNINSILIILLFTLTFFDLIFFKKEIKSFSFGYSIWVVIPFFVFIIGIFWSINLKEAFKELTATISFLAFPVIFSHLNKYYKINYRLVFKIFIFSCLFKFLFFFISLIDYDPEALFSLSYWKTILFRLNRLFNERAIHPTYYSLFLGICVFLCIYLADKSKKKYRYLWLLLAGFLILVIVGIMAKMPLIALIISFFIVGLINIIKNFHKKRIALYLSGFFVVILSMFFFLKKVPNTFVQDFYNYKNLFLGKEISDNYDYSKFGSSSELESWRKTNRLFLWETGLQVWKKHVFLGTGTGDYKQELNKQYLQNNYIYLAEASMNTHNQYLSYLVQYGILGFLIIGFCFIIICQKIYKSKSYVFMGILLLFALTCLTENVLDRQWGIVSFSFFISLFLVYNIKKTLPPHRD